MLPRPRQTLLRTHSSSSSATPKKLSLAQTPYSRQQGGGNNAKFGRFHTVPITRMMKMISKL